MSGDTRNEADDDSGRTREESPPEAGGAVPEGVSASTIASLEAELRGWLALVEQTLAAGNQFSRLLALELKLAAGDAGRLLGIVLAAVPVVILAWLGFSALLGWFAYTAGQSVAWGLAGFTLVQILALCTMGLAARRYSRSLALPATRRQWRAMREKENGGRSQTADP